MTVGCSAKSKEFLAFDSVCWSNNQLNVVLIASCFSSLFACCFAAR
eukprot:CAMPEP_0170453516 /NCGR_PEP_ID=MMETSP0123-20130129/2070_1 /TAXON_ID=182087 /ORGANISM="Favella ehrenbergii, Strain Fehren 1" /LENGTH=45 /DNA_ID= /DNA_START= /DNA_END= /DNA_ORIENTATION=